MIVQDDGFADLRLLLPLSLCDDFLNERCKRAPTLAIVVCELLEGCVVGEKIGEAQVFGLHAHICVVVQVFHVHCVRGRDANLGGMCVKVVATPSLSVNSKEPDFTESRSPSRPNQPVVFSNVKRSPACLALDANPRAASKPSFEPGGGGASMASGN